MQKDRLVFGLIVVCFIALLVGGGWLVKDLLQPGGEEIATETALPAPSSPAPAFQTDEADEPQVTPPAPALEEAPPLTAAVEEEKEAPKPLANGIITGVILDARTRKPLAGYEVAVADSKARDDTDDENRRGILHQTADDDSPISAPTDETGVFVIKDVPAGVVELVITAEDTPFVLHYPQVEVPEDGTCEKEILVDLSCSASGIVTSALDETPIANATVVIEAQKRHNIEPYYTGKAEIETALDGAYKLSNVPPVRVEASASGVGHVKTTLEPFGLASGEHRGHVDFVLHAGCVITGIVRNSAGEAVSQAKVGLVPGNGIFDMLGEGSIQSLESAFDDIEQETDEEGRFHLDAAPAGISIQVNVLHDDYAPGLSEKIKLAPGSRKDITIVLEEGGVISGRVVNESDEPVSNARISSRPDKSLLDMAVSTLSWTEQIRRATTDEEGRYRLTGIDGSGDAMVVEVKHEAYMDDKQKGVQVASGEETTVDFILERGGHLTGFVIAQATGEPVPGAALRLRKISPFTMEFETYHTASETNGYFRFDGLKEGPYDFEASAPGYAVFKMDNIAPFTEGMQVELSSAGVVTGRVIAGGVPAEQFTIRLIAHAANTRMGGAFGMGNMGQSEDEESFAPLEGGIFRMENVEPGAYVVEARASGFAPAKTEPVEVLSGEETPVSLSLTPGGIISGIVVAKTGDGPIANAVVYLGEAQFLAGIVNLQDEDNMTSAKTDKEGRFQLNDVTSGTYYLTCTHQDYMTAVVKKIRVISGQETSGVEIALSTGGILEGHVWDPANRPQEGVQVMIFSPGGDVGKRGSTDEEGFYRIQGLASGQYMAMKMGGAVAEDAPNSLFGGFRFMNVTITEGETTELNFGAERGVRMYGKVLTAGVPAPNMMIQASQYGGGGAGMDMRMATADAQGDYEIADLRTGKYRVQIMGHGQHGGASSKDVTIPNVTDFHYDIHLEQGAISGTVVSVDKGNPVAGAMVYLTLEETGTAGTLESEMKTSMVATSISGGFRFQNLGAGSYRLQAGAQGYGQIIINGITLGLGEDKSGLDIRLEESLEITGSVRTGEGAAVAAAQLMVRTSGTHQLVILRGEGGSLSTKQDGTFTISGLEAGDYDVTALKEGFAPGTAKNISASDTPQDVEMILTDGDSLVLHVTSGSGVPLEGAAVIILDSNGIEIPDTDAGGMSSFFGTNLTDAQGTFMRDHLPVGPATAMVSLDGYLANTANLSITEGGLAEGGINLLPSGP